MHFLRWAFFMQTPESICVVFSCIPCKRSPQDQRPSECLPIQYNAYRSWSSPSAGCALPPTGQATATGLAPLSVATRGHRTGLSPWSFARTGLGNRLVSTVGRQGRLCTGPKSADLFGICRSVWCESGGGFYTSLQDLCLAWVGGLSKLYSWRASIIALGRSTK